MTSAQSQAQEALHRERAASATLANVRIISERAAKAWCALAIQQEEREAKIGVKGSLPEAGSLSEQRDDQSYEREG